MSIKFIPKSKKRKEAWRNGGDREGDNKSHMQNDQENPSSVAQTEAKEFRQNRAVRLKWRCLDDAGRPRT